MNEQDQLLEEFLVEARENLDHIDEELLALEINPTDSSLLRSLFRRIHTLKGVCGFLDFGKLEAVSHAGEGLLDELRNDRLVVDDTVISILLRLCDAMKTIVTSIEKTGNEGDFDYSAILSELSALVRPRDLVSQVDQQRTLDAEFEAMLDTMEATDNKEGPKEEPRGQSEGSQTSNVNSIARETSGERSEHTTRTVGSSDSSLRVDVDLLDHLVNLAGELVLARNQLLQSTKSLPDPSFRQMTQRLNLITSELQESVMKTRMQPISTVWSRFPRVARDIAAVCNKQVRLEMQGKETELDKTLIEAIKDPITHILRNAIDHGIESPEARRAAGKNPEGCITMRSFQEGGYVIIQIIDDGAGLDTEKIRERAIERGIISRDKSLVMSEADINKLVFTPGFSTAATVTNISGRGVGMDVVKASVERIGGHVDLSSSAGKGSEIRLKIPLTLAIIPALLLSCGAQRLAIPQTVVTELLRFVISESSGLLSWIGTKPFFKLREELLPLIFLDKHLHMSESSNAADAEHVIVVLDAGGCRFGVVVDRVHDTEEIVIKPLGRLLEGLHIYAGATILGDGQIALIVDPVVLAREAYIEQKELSTVETDDQLSLGPVVSMKQFLVVQLCPEMRAALPLSTVCRLENFDVSDIERIGGASVIRYRDSILRLIDVASAVGLKPIDEHSGQVVVIGSGDSAVGLCVQSIVDVSADLTAVRPAHDQPGIHSFAVLGEQVIALLDVDFLLRADYGDVTLYSEERSL